MSLTSSSSHYLTRLVILIMSSQIGIITKKIKFRQSHFKHQHHDNVDEDLLGTRGSSYYMYDNDGDDDNDDENLT